MSAPHQQNVDETGAVPIDNQGPLGQISFYLGRAYYNYVGFLEQLLEEFDLSQHIRPGMGHVLFALYEQDECIIRDIARKVRLSKSTLTAILKRMEKAKLITRRRCSKDGRAIRVRLTTLARSLEPRSHELLTALNEIMSQGLTPDEIADTRQTLAQMTTSMRRYVRKTPYDGNKA